MSRRPVNWTAAVAVAALAIAALRATVGGPAPLRLRASLEPAALIVNSGPGGTIVALGAREGDLVRKGRLLARLETGEAAKRRAELSALLRSLESALATGEVLDRIPAALRERVFASNPDVAAAENAYLQALDAYQQASPDARAQAEARLQKVGEERTRVRRSVGKVLGRGGAVRDELTAFAASLRQNLAALAQTEIVAPCDGTLEVFQLQVGARALPASPIAVLIPPGQYTAQLAIPAALASGLRTGMPVHGTLLPPHTDLTATIEAITTREVPVPFRVNRAISQETIVRVRISSPVPLPPGAAAEFQLP